jgi:hypothetical protein
MLLDKIPLLRMVVYLSLKDQAVQEERLLDPEVEGIWSFATSGTAHTVTQCHNSAD